MLKKDLFLGGMCNRSPKTKQDDGRFRVARNVYPTPNNKLIPRFDVLKDSTQPVDNQYVHYMTKYQGSVLSARTILDSGTYYLELFKDNLVVPNQRQSLGYTDVGAFNASPNNSFQFTSYSKNNTVYFLNPNAYYGEPFFFKYDGVEVSAMGCPQPRISSVSYSSGGSNYLRCIGHRIDFDNNEPTSEYIQFPFAPAASITVRTDKATTNIIGSTNVIPQYVLSDTTETPYYRGSAAYNAGTNAYDITTTDTNISLQGQLGSYVFVQVLNTFASVTGFGEDVIAIAMRIKTVSPLSLDATGVRYLTKQREWKTGTITTGAAFNIYCSSGSREIYTFWASNNANGNYVWRGITLAFPYSNVAHNVTVDTSSVTTTVSSLTDNVAPTISPNLGDWYNVVIKKLSPNSVYFSGSLQMYALSQYQDLLLFLGKDLIYFSDTSLAGSFEQLNAVNAIRVGGSEYGNIVAACGTMDFLFVGRERKNYLVNGNLSTGNFRVQEIADTEVGPWGNNCAINVKDSVVFISSRGVFQLTSGGRVHVLTDKIPENFATFDDLPTNEDVLFKLSNTNFVDTPLLGSNYGLSISYDEYRELLFFCQIGPNFSSNPVLVLHTKTGEFFEWEGFINETNKFVSYLLGYNGVFYVSTFENTIGYMGAEWWVENKDTNIQYPIYYPVKLYSTWNTFGEPSLEKEILQLKMFGKITGEVKVVHYKDWDYNTKITDVTFTPEVSGQYSNKKRLVSDKALSVSYGMEIVDSGNFFELDSLELEINPIQRGMKR